MSASSLGKPIAPGPENQKAMSGLMEELFPVYRSLAGPGYEASLKIIQKSLPLEINKFASGTQVFDWTIPKEFKVNHSYVTGPDGRKYFDYDQCSYHVFVYSQPFEGEMDREELVKHIRTHHQLDDAVPIGVTYYRPKWGLCGSKKQVDALPPGQYKVSIDTEHFDGHLRIGEYYLPGKTEEEILISSYLCHPLGANDNLSGVVVATELFKLLSTLPERHYSYRLAIWPETIGAITYIYHYPERIKKTVGGYVLLCLGDEEGGGYHYNCSFKRGDALVDRAMIHALKRSGHEHVVMKNDLMHSDERQFNSIGVRVPFGALTTSPPAEYSTYHTSLDNLDYVKPRALQQSLEIYWKALMTLELNRTYKGNFTCEPFLSRYGIYPYDLGVGEGTMLAKSEEARDRACAFYYFMWNADGTKDLLEIAEDASYDIEYFERPAKDFLQAGLVEEITPPSADPSSDR